MNVQEHPEYELYQRDADLVAICRQAVGDWIASGEEIVAPDGVVWTPRRARAFVAGMGRLFQRYNFVLWQSFSYCRRCQGGCCVVGASQVTQFDALALALLEQPFPSLAPRAAASDCIYLGQEGCRWPTQWRPIKCASFYCLGSGDWELDAADARYAQITQALQEVVREHLPGYLQPGGYGAKEPLHNFLGDPIGFAEMLGAVLLEIFVGPFAASYDAGLPLPAASGSLQSVVDAGSSSQEALSFIASAVETVWQTPSPVTAMSDAQFLADLERLEWIVMERPPGSGRELQTLLGEYGCKDVTAGDAGVRATLRGRMALTLEQLLLAYDDRRG